MSSWEIARFKAPAVLAHYARLTWCNRTSRRRPIRVAAKYSTSRQNTTAPARGDVVVPIYNNFDDTKALLEALKEDASIDGKIILVNDCSPDERINPLLSNYSQTDVRAVLIQNETNCGFVQTCNRGIAASSSDVVILNTDIELPPGAVSRILACLRSGPHVASVTPFSNNAYGVGVPWLAYVNEKPFGASTDQIDQCFQDLQRSSSIELPSGIGFCMGMSRAVIAKIGAFDEKFGLGYGEETDFCQRAKSMGFKNLLAADTYVYHRGGQSFGSTWQDKSRKATLEILRRHPGYVNAVAQHLAFSPVRSIAFAALAQIAEKVTGQPLRIADKLEAESASPQIFVRDQGSHCLASLSAAGDTYDFVFSDRTIVESSLALRRNLNS